VITCHGLSLVMLTIKRHLRRPTTVQVFDTQVSTDARPGLASGVTVAHHPDRQCQIPDL